MILLQRRSCIKLHATSVDMKTMIYKTLQRKIRMIEQRESYENRG